MSEDRRYNYQNRLSDKQYLSAKIGETSRFIAFGIVALVFSVQNSNGELSAIMRGSYGPSLYLAGFLAVGSIFFDYCQYISGYLSVNDALRRQSHDYTYDAANIFYQLRRASFWLKQVFAFWAATTILVIMTLMFVLNAHQVC